MELGLADKVVIVTGAAGGALINVASMYATFGSPRNPAYAPARRRLCN